MLPFVLVPDRAVSGPAGHPNLVRRTPVKFVDPEKRIALPPVKPGVGW